MNKLQTLLFSIIMSFSGVVCASELTKEQQNLKEDIKVAVGVFVCLKEGVEVVPLLDDDMEDAFEKYMFKVIASGKKGIELPERDWEEIDQYEQNLTKAIQQAKRN